MIILALLYTSVADSQGTHRRDRIVRTSTSTKKCENFTERENEFYPKRQRADHESACFLTQLELSAHEKKRTRKVYAANVARASPDSKRSN